MKRSLAVVVAAISLNSYAGSFETVVDTAAIQKIIDKIPAKDGTFATRTASLGITVRSITIQHVTKEDAEGDPFSRPGDVAYTIDTNAGEMVDDCEVLGGADINKRGNLYIMESRTANWIVKGICEAP